MKLFKQSKPDPDLWEGLGRLRRSQEVLEGQMKQLKLEWDETFDKIRRLTSRLAKRDAIDKRRSEATNGDTSEPEFPQVDSITQKILARRNRTIPR